MSARPPPPIPSPPAPLASVANATAPVDPLLATFHGLHDLHALCAGLTPRPDAPDARVSNFDVIRALCSCPTVRRSFQPGPSLRSPRHLTRLSAGCHFCLLR